MNVDPFRVTYCTNVHPGESIQAVLSTLNHAVPAVKSLVAPKGTFGAGLRLGHQAVHALESDPKTFDELQSTLQEQDLDVFTVNGFPYGEFG
jgi:hypothetical protein